MDNPTRKWRCVLELDAARNLSGGSDQALAEAVGGGQDLRIYTEFRHNEHIDVTSDDDELVQEVAEFRVTYLVDGRWVAGIMSLRQPVELPVGFGPRPSMSFFLYNQDGGQAIARPHLDGEIPRGAPGPSEPQSPGGMSKYHAQDSWDTETNAPSYNFVYDFDRFRFNVSDRWRQLLAHGADGRVTGGSVAELADAFARGSAVKVAIEGLCADLGGDGLRHELFVETHSGYYYTDKRLFIAGTQPVIRVRPAIPMRYESGNWDFGWLVVRTDSAVVFRRCDPYSLAFDDRELRCGMRWFAD